MLSHNATDSLEFCIAAIVALAIPFASIAIVHVCAYLF